jgi:hypothetical protein
MSLTHVSIGLLWLIYLMIVVKPCESSTSLSPSQPLTPKHKSSWQKWAQNRWPLAAIGLKIDSVGTDIMWSWKYLPINWPLSPPCQPLHPTLGEKNLGIMV